MRNSFAIGLVTACLSIAACSVLGVTAEIEGREVFFDSAEVQLAGLWFTPPREPPYPAAVMIRGSGSSSRDNYWARSIVDVLLSSGVAVLLPDKRGSDASGGDWRIVGFDSLADDAASAVRFVRTLPDVDSGKVGIVGLSQGGKIAPVAASRTADLGFIINVVGSATTLAEQISWEMFHGGSSGESTTSIPSRTGGASTPIILMCGRAHTSRGSYY